MVRGWGVTDGIWDMGVGVLVWFGFGVGVGRGGMDSMCMCWGREGEGRGEREGRQDECRTIRIRGYACSEWKELKVSASIARYMH